MDADWLQQIMLQYTHTRYVNNFKLIPQPLVSTFPPLIHKSSNIFGFRPQGPRHLLLTWR